jgi:hypothetical protein
MKYSRLSLVILVLSVAVVPACSGTGIEPSPAEPAAAEPASLSVDVAAAEVRPVTGSATGQQAIYSASSPCRDPFVAPVGLIVRATRDFNVHVRQIRTQVVTDSMQLRMPQVTIAAPLLIEEFGTDLVRAQSNRLFPLRVMVGCGIKTGAVVVDVDADDDRGRSHTGRVTVRLR